MADDLDDEWWLQGKERAVDSDTSHSDTTQESKVKKIQKRKISTEGEAVSKVVSGTVQPAAKKKKGNRKGKVTDVEERDKIPTKPNDLVTAMTKYYDGKLSTFEWDAVKMEDTFFTESKASSHTPTTYLKLLLPKWQQLISVTSPRVPLVPGSPILLIVTSAAIRATQLNRDIQEFKGDTCKVAKLFAKHYKLKDQVAFLSKSKIHIGIGTPSRIQALIENDSLKLENVKRVVIDWSWRELKMRRLIDMPDVRSQLFDLLKTSIIPRLKEGNCKLALM